MLIGHFIFIFGEMLSIQVYCLFLNCTCNCCGWGGPFKQHILKKILKTEVIKGSMKPTHSVQSALGTAEELRLSGGLIWFVY